MHFSSWTIDKFNQLCRARPFTLLADFESFAWHCCVKTCHFENADLARSTTFAENSRWPSVRRPRCWQGASGPTTVTGSERPDPWRSGQLPKQLISSRGGIPAIKRVSKTAIRSVYQVLLGTVGSELIFPKGGANWHCFRHFYPVPNVREDGHRFRRLRLPHICPSTSSALIWNWYCRSRSSVDWQSFHTGSFNVWKRATPLAGVMVSDPPESKEIFTLVKTCERRATSKTWKWHGVPNWPPLEAQ